MCGIAGYLGPKSPQLSMIADRLARSLAHRGPDGEGRELLPVGRQPDRCLLLVHRRLAIIDLSPLGRQPMVDADTGNWITYNGEIFNFRELREELEGVGVRFRSQSDTEVILKLYAAHGLKALDRLRGMFALVLWDKAQQTLLLAVDPLGVKPLYYYRGGDGSFLFASEVRALLASGFVPRALDPVAVEGYLAYGAAQAPNTIIRDVRGVRGGTYVLVRDDGRVGPPVRYWAPRFAQASEPGVELEPVLFELRDLLTTVIRQHLVSDVPVGVFLSGGIDSSSIVALMRRVALGWVHTFSVTFAEQEYCEGRFAKAIADRYSDKHHEICLSDRDLLETLPGALAAMDQPTIDGINVYVIARAAHEAGMKVVLSGQGGDEVFGGYRTFRLVSNAIAWRRRLSFIRAPTWRRMAAVCAFCKSRRVIPDKLSQFLAADGGVLSTFLILRQLFPPATRDMLFPDRPTCETTLGLPRMLADEIADDVAHLDPINQVSLLEMRTYLGNMLLRDGDFMTMAHGLEARVPMLDRRLVDFVARVPGRQKMDRRLPKALLLRAMGGSLPRMIYERPKQGFTFPWDVWLRGRLRPRLEECLESRALCESAGLAWPACRDLWQAFLERRPGLSWSRAWGLFVLLDWCRRHGARLS